MEITIPWLDTWGAGVVVMKEEEYKKQPDLIVNSGKLASHLLGGGGKRLASFLDGVNSRLLFFEIF